MNAIHIRTQKDTKRIHTDTLKNVLNPLITNKHAKQNNSKHDKTRIQMNIMHIRTQKCIDTPFTTKTWTRSQEKAKHENKQTITDIGTRRFTKKHSHEQACNPHQEKTKHGPFFLFSHKFASLIFYFLIFLQASS